MTARRAGLLQESINPFSVVILCGAIWKRTKNQDFRVSISLSPSVTAGSQETAQILFRQQSQ